MGSLSAHLRQAGGHGRLEFHPACPVCREQRLAGALPYDALVGGRMPALLAAGLLAFSSVSPTVALAQEGDQDHALAADPVTTTAASADPAAGSAGGADPATGSAGGADPSTSSASAADPVSVSAPGADVVAGPDDTDETVDDAGVVGGGNADEDAGPVGPDLVAEGDPSGDSIATAGDSAAPAPAASTPTAQSRTVAAPSVDAPNEAGANSSAAEVPAAPDAAGSGSADRSSAAAGGPAAPAPTAASDATPVAHGAARDGKEKTRPARRLRRHVKAHRIVVRAARTNTVSGPEARTQPSVTAVTYVAQQPSASPAPVAVGAHRGRSARPGDRVHVVVAGESLWSVAEDVLGGRAAVGDVAHEVDRLWMVNRERIGTGDRNVLPIGTRLVLR